MGGGGGGGVEGDFFDGAGGGGGAELVEVVQGAVGADFQIDGPGDTFGEDAGGCGLGVEFGEVSAAEIAEEVFAVELGGEFGGLGVVEGSAGDGTAAEHGVGVHVSEEGSG